MRDAMQPPRFPSVKLPWTVEGARLQKASNEACRKNSAASRSTQDRVEGFRP
jgi:hypothetical protein